ncbi:helix-turn-helix domain-containing protein [Streptomyces sp. SKN60]|uniref:helix-turn-helix domain-containing protein n=1 Tax=Streptomyces sp. SKN60 TaxID=2855506 RepID=UPI0027E58A63|nr:helix-turn-helix domain-containing protein [Streptomyces sp. SKN60]
MVVGNDLAQHRKLSLQARGLALYLESLPAGASVGIKAIAAECPNSELSIARAMRELEAVGYLKRFRERLPDGRFVHRTVSYNRPGAEPEPVRKTPPRPPSPPPVRQKPAPPAPRPAPPPPIPLAERHRAAAELLAGLRVHNSRLLLSERDIERLAPGVTAWLDRGVRPDAIRRTLSANLPADLAHPAGLLTHRLTALLPPRLPTAPLPSARPVPFQTCETCDRAFRSPAPGHCRDCRPAEAPAA